MSETIMTDEGFGVAAVSMEGAPGCKVQIAEDHGQGTWTAFASCGGAASMVFAGKSFKSQKSAIAAAKRWLLARVEQRADNARRFAEDCARLAPA